MSRETDISDTIVAKSDQLNADDILAGPITVTVTAVKRTNDDQPVAVHISGGYQPWKPCKTMRRALVAAWGKDPTKWAGRSVTLKRDASVKWAGEEVGGIRIHALSHIEKRMELSLAETRGKKKKFVIERLAESATEQTLVQKYAKRLSELNTKQEIESAYEKFRESAKSMPESVASEIEEEFNRRLKELQPT